MATQDPVENAVNITVAVLGARAADFLAALGAKFGLPREVVEGDPSVALSLPAGASGMSSRFHFSGYESDRARADAVVSVGAFDADDVPRGCEIVHSESDDPMDAVKAASKAALLRIREREVPLMPSAVREGLHRHDKAASPALLPTGAPRKGNQLKVQINLREGEGWLAMAGTVHTVVSDNVVEADVVVSTDQAPPAFDGTWRARLERFDGWQYPWVLTSLARSER